MGRWRCSFVDPLSDAFILTALTVFFLAPQTCLGTTPAQPQQDVEQGTEIPNVKYTVITHNVARPAHRSDYVKMKDKNGKEFDCVMPSKTTEEQDAQHVEEQKKQADINAKSEQELPSLDSLLAPLTGRCFLRPDGYWNFELCHGKKIRQFHEEARKTTVEYSLGDFDRAVVPKVVSKDTMDSSVVKHYFEGGTRCDETNGPRHAVVLYRCVEGKENHIESMKEDATCSYTIVFATPLLCDHPLLAGGTHAGSHVKPRVSDYLVGLSGTCFYRVEGWWTYEFCYQKHLKQFHQENSVNTAEFMLGTLFSMLLPGSYVDPQTYTKGTICDVTGEPRQVEVQFKCATDSLNVVSSIKEKSTCKYALVFYTPLICNHPAFQSKKGKSTDLHLICLITSHRHRPPDRVLPHPK
ncbi:hypothetical protein GUITHDRAFT_148825 [Guillardia theta CCMP2712]|uniref:MRH domain-containing protein n=1 Tax=Guillardia theta (strain CCMP2712) TaxID=905079 RepID=L1I797_GUITC|nr:hypothetical protein GUITHDRAFT_148825 [Guillardia theta CCMP2712]EKX32128.1 hypothetical protein GUITHDRAFT_148825 [Guillardia theta CCMP2712]|eukprot:XP_005819108.1 hypothetical protein GUITHDRAFT_148825 [Guillardia theta CCMP2712]